MPCKSAEKDIGRVGESPELQMTMVMIKFGQGVNNFFCGEALAIKKCLTINVSSYINMFILFWYERSAS
jgi:hypothetical protein